MLRVLLALDWLLVFSGHCAMACVQGKGSTAKEMRRDVELGCSLGPDCLSHCNQCRLLFAAFRSVLRNADVHLRGNLLLHDLTTQMMRIMSIDITPTTRATSSLAWRREFVLWLPSPMLTPMRIKANAMQDSSLTSHHNDFVYHQPRPDVPLPRSGPLRERGERTSKDGPFLLTEEPMLTTVKPKLDGAPSPDHPRVCALSCLGWSLPIRCTLPMLEPSFHTNNTSEMSAII